MFEDMVMRSVYLRPLEDAQLRQLAHERNVTKSDLIRSAISVKLRDWLASDSEALIVHDLSFGQRESAANRAQRTTAAKAKPAKAATKVAEKEPAAKARPRKATSRVPA